MTMFCFQCLGFTGNIIAVWNNYQAMTNCRGNSTKTDPENGLAYYDHTGYKTAPPINKRFNCAHDLYNIGK